MRRRTFLATLPAAALAGPSFATERGDNPNRDRPDVLELVQKSTFLKFCGRK